MISDTTTMVAAIKRIASPTQGTAFNKRDDYCAMNDPARKDASV